MQCSREIAAPSDLQVPRARMNDNRLIVGDLTGLCMSAKIQEYIGMTDR